MTDEQVAAYRGMSVLNSHRRWNVGDDILGSVVEVWRDDISNVGLSLLGRIQIDQTEPKVAAKVKSSSIQQVSGVFEYLDGATVQMREGNVPLILQPALFPQELVRYRRCRLERSLPFRRASGAYHLDPDRPVDHQHLGDHYGSRGHSHGHGRSRQRRRRLADRHHEHACHSAGDQARATSDPVN